MTELNVKSSIEKPLGEGLVIRALAISAPAFSIAVLSAVYLQPANGIISWLGIGLVLLLGLATAVSYIGLSRLNPTAEPANFGSLRFLLWQGSKSGWVAVCRAIAFWATQVCYWIIPALWLGLASGVTSYLACQIWPQVPMDSPWVAIATATVLGLGLSYLPFHGIRGIIAVNVAIGALQICGLIVVVVLIAMHRTSVRPGVAALTLDSNGTPTQFVQDTVPDTTRAIPDPSDPTKQIHDPNATLPKFDSSGNPIWVYEAVDTNGNVLKDTGGSPIIVPTDANGNLAPLPEGAANAVPQAFVIRYTGGIDDAGNYVYHVKSATVPIGQSVVAAEGIVGLFSLAIFQLIASIGVAPKFKRRLTQIVVILLVITPLSAFCLLGYLSKQSLTDFAHSYFYGSAGGSSAPIGDMVQLIGSWAFGSPTAGWWLFVFEYSLLLLTLIAATWMSFQTTALPAAAGDHKGSRAVRHFHILFRAGVAILLSVAGTMVLSARLSASNPFATPSAANPWFNDSALGRLGYKIATSIPDLSSVLTLAGTLVVLILCTFICLMFLSTTGAGPNKESIGKSVISVLGALIGAALIVFYLTAPFFIEGAGLMESASAFMICGFFGIVVARPLLLRQRKPLTP